MRRTLAEQQEDLKDQRRMMEKQSHQLEILARHMLNVASDNSNNAAEEAKLATTKTRKHSECGESDDNNVSGGRDVSVADVFSTDPKQAAGPFSSKTSKGTKPHTAIPGKSNAGKNHFNNSHHRSSFNSSTNSNNAGNSTVSNGSTVCLNVPPTATQANSYRGSKRSAPAPLFRGYNRKK